MRGPPAGGQYAITLWIFREIFKSARTIQNEGPDLPTVSTS
jgi:hypothetical protein